MRIWTKLFKASSMAIKQFSIYKALLISQSQFSIFVRNTELKIILLKMQMRRSVILILFILAACRVVSQENWQPINFPDSLLAKKINCEKEGTIFIATGNNNNYSGLFRSLDYGITWKHLTVDTVVNWAHIYSMKFHPDGDLFIGCSWGIYISHDNGDNFEQVYNGGGNILSLNIAPDSSIYATTWSYILRSRDSGNSWDTAYFSSAPNMCFTDLAFGLNNEIYATANSYSNSGEGFYRSLDNGETWENTGITDLFLDYIEVNPTGMIITGGSEASLYQSEDKGDTWLKRSEVGANSVVRDYNGTIYAYSDYMSIWKGYRTSDNWGTTWSDPDNYPIDKYVKGLSISDQQFIYLITSKSSDADTCIYRSTKPILENREPYKIDQFSVYPNPSDCQIRLNCLPDNATEYVIIDVNGKQLISGKLSSSGIDVSLLNSGIYMIRVSSLKESAIAKFIIRK